MIILCTIDLETREVSLPAGQVIASYDHNVDVIRFQAEPIEDFSLNLSSIRIAAQGPNKSRHDYAVDPSTVAIEEETGYITFDWPIPQGVTEMPIGTFKYGDKGQLIFAVCAEIISGSTVSKAWHSDDGIITVVAHLEPESGGGEDPEEEATNAQKIGQLQTDVAVVQREVSAVAGGTPTVVDAKADMTEHDKIYILSTDSKWYYYSATAEDWVIGGTYGGVPTDPTLTQEGMPADAKAVGDALAEKADSDDLTAVDERVSNLKSAINISSPALTLNANKYVYITGDIFNGNGFSYTDPVEVKKGDHITLTAAGYSTNVAMISECESDGTITSVVAKSSDDSVQKYEHMMLHDGYVCFSFMHTKSYKVEIIGGQVVEPTIAFKLTADAYRFIPFEKGNIVISNSGWTYATSDTRIRTPEGYTVHCHAGDTFGLSSYSNARFYVGWKRSDGTYGNLGWLQRDFTVMEEGDYIFTITAVPETTVSNVEDLSSLCEYSITKPVDDVYEYVNSFAALVPQNNNIRSVNHRGWHEAPENTLTAFKQSRVRGFEYVETDVRFTSDGVAVLLHDASINRIARNADGTAISSTVNIADITYAEALTYDFGIYKGSQYAGTKIARFDDFINLCKKIGLKPYIEFKTGPYDGLLGMFWRIDRAGMHDKVTWLSFDKDLLGTVKTNASDARLGLLTDTISQTVIDAAENLKSSDNDVFINASYANLTDELVNLCLTANLPLEVWTVDDKSTLINIDRYVTGVTSNLFIAGKELFKANI